MRRAPVPDRQRWRTLGHVHVAAGEVPGHATHASYPTPLRMPDGSLRVFFSPRDEKGRSGIWSLDLALWPDGFEKLAPPRGPWLEAGPAGAFDDAGASVGWVGWHPDGGLDCWFLGWSLGRSVPFRTAIGRARAAPGEDRLHRTSFAPALDRDATDPLSLGYPWLARDGDGLSIWYGTHQCPPRDGRAIDHPVRRAWSRDDGATWVRDARLALDHAYAGEWALSRPCILRDAAGWHAWYCRRLDAYALGYAHSADGSTWLRDDGAVAFTTPEAPWEQGCRTYPAVFDHGGHRYMLYNGVGYGRTGFGIAVLEG
ncbi:hypothetical protein SAMN02745775_101379 [Falsiroseomonas stagni DSM 19981]|uniref:Glycosyl hydrolases family 43 n=1 Tax=Falsiroseomonas stagni DSM 19981 TaxID=1123062 RepID=A0A1I3XJ67_9PROT|nr:hypothetical protein SAMN02745775_101379 [Falsiroseomonas stagni DSM 19981]